MIKATAKATYVQVWWPAFDTPVYVDLVPRWDGTNYTDPVTGTPLPTWEEALDQADPDEPVACDPARARRSTSRGSSPRPRMRTGPSGI